MRTEILYEDSDILVVYKPAGIATQAAGLMQADVVSELKNYLAQSNQKTETREPYLGLIHRLDQPVEGLLVFAKTPRAAAALSRQITERTLKKEYLAVVLMENGKRSEQNPVSGGTKTLHEKMTLTDYLVKDGKTNMSKVGKAADPKAKKAILSYEFVKMDESNATALLKICLDTGRHHQIRVQMANAGMPLLGDFKYGTEASQNLSKKLGVKDVALCAHKIILKHPKTGKTEEFTVLPKKQILRDLAG